MMPGVRSSMTQGSRADGMFCIVSRSNVDFVPVSRVSTSGLAPVTVTVSCTVESSSAPLTCARKPMVTRMSCIASGAEARRARRSPSRCRSAAPARGRCRSLRSRPRAAESARDPRPSRSRRATRRPTCRPPFRRFHRSAAAPQRPSRQEAAPTPTRQASFSTSFPILQNAGVNPSEGHYTGHPDLSIVRPNYRGARPEEQQLCHWSRAKACSGDEFRPESAKSRDERHEFRDEFNPLDGLVQAFECRVADRSTWEPFTL